MLTKVLDYCRKKLDSRLANLDEVFTCFRRSPLHVAVLSDDIKFANRIISLKPSLASKKDNQGWTPLHLASARASLQMVKLLLNAEPNACLAKDEDQRTPLHLAVMNDRVEIMEVLMEEGPPQQAAINPKNYQNGETILHFCVKSNCSVRTLELLVDKLALARTSDPSVIINSKDYNGKTVLQLAAETGKTEMVQHILESGYLKLEITDSDFAEALNALSPENKNDLKTGFLKYPGEDKKHKSKTLPKNGDEHEGLKDRVNALMVVATLIAGIAFQAAMNPPGGVWQDDSKVNSSTDPVTFAYHLDRMFSTPISGSLDRYIQDNLNNNGNNVRQNNIINDFVGVLMHTFGTDYYVTGYKGLILEDSAFTDVVSSHNNSDGNGGNYFPYLIRYAGYPILAYTYPANYVVYTVTNGVALLASLTIITLVACGFMIEKTINQVRFLVVLMCISIACIAISYMSILQAMLPDFYNESKRTFIILQVFFGICCILGAGLFIWSFARELIKLRKRHQHFGVINYFDYIEAFFFGMDAKAAGKLILFTVSYFALNFNGFIYYGSWGTIVKIRRS
ncbi:hypothetical protein MKX01_026504 [Papaver californicum]|nr:hypothetical protein MKX01_026504 [Papaver californicum]